MTRIQVTHDLIRVTYDPRRVMCDLDGPALSRVDLGVPQPGLRLAPSRTAWGLRYHLGRINRAASDGKPVRLAMTLAESLGKPSIARATPVSFRPVAAIHVV